MKLELNDVVMMVDAENKKVACIETVDCVYGHAFSTLNFEISENLEATYRERSDDEEKYEIAKVWRFSKEKNDLVIIYPEQEKEETKTDGCVHRS